MGLYALIIMFVGALSAGLLTGCETMKGVGKDITDASTSVQQTLFE